MFQGLPGISIVLGLAVIISKCVGAGDYEQAEFYKRKVSRIIHAANTLFSVIVVALMPFLMMIYDLSDQATHYVWIIVLAHGILVSIFWNSGYVLPVVFRSAGDANFPMVIGIASMLLVRVVCAYFYRSILVWECSELGQLCSQTGLLKVSFMKSATAKALGKITNQYDKTKKELDYPIPFGLFNATIRDKQLLRHLGQR